MTAPGRRLCARDVMQTRVFTLGPDHTLEAALALFREQHVGGAPVVDRLGRLLGVVSVFDVLAALEAPDSEGGCAVFLRDHPLSWTTEWSFRVGASLGELRAKHVSDVMTRAVVVAPPDASVAELARVMREQRIHRLVICDAERMLGIVSSFDLLAALDPGTD